MSASSPHEGGGPRLVVFAGGGTGGHLFPGIAIAEELRGLMPETTVAFACSSRAIDREILVRAGVGFEPVVAHPFAGGLRTRARFVVGWGASRRDAVRVLRGLMREANADAARTLVISTGGFVAPPMVVAAEWLGVAAWTLNLDATPGRANRWIAGRCSRVFTVYPFGGWTSIAPVVRRSILGMEQREAKRALGLDPEKPVLAVMGGSLGATSLNRFVAAVLGRHGAELASEGWQLVHQTGKDGESDARAAAARAGWPAVVREFFDERDGVGVGAVWAAADLAVARAGAGNVAEARATGTPTVFVPYPYHRDQHQRRNAEPVVRAGGARLIDDLIAPEQTLERFGSVVVDLLQDPDARAKMRSLMVGMGPVDGAETVARAIRGLG